MKTSTFQLTRNFLFIAVALLFAFGVGSLLRITFNPQRAGLYAFYAFAMFADAAFLLLCALWLNKRTRAVFAFLIAVLTLNIFLTIFDQFGLADFLFVSLNLIALVLLILSRREFFPA